MASAPQALITYEGVEAILDGSFTLSHGVTPSSLTLRMAPQLKPMPVVGTVVISYGNGKIIFPDCRAHGLSVEINGLTTWEITVMDHRWRWCFGEISGEYNIRDANGKIIEEALKSARDLVKLLFEAMGETKVDVSRVPTNVFPEKKWEIARPDQELSSLCDELGLRVVLSPPNNQVTIWPQGEGAQLPKGATLENTQQLFELPDAPDIIIFRPGRSQYQKPLRLEPVAAESTGEIVLLNKVSYTPVGDPILPWTVEHPWGCHDPPFANAVCPPEVDEKKRQKRKESRDLATKWVFRGYRVKDSEILGDLGLALPLNNFQLVKKTGELDGFGKHDPLARIEAKEGHPPVVFGRWNIDSASTNLDIYRERTIAQITDEQRDITKRPAPTGQYDLHPTERYNKPFTLDVDRGLILFSEPVFELLWRDDISAYIKLPAVLYLVVSFGIRDKKTRAWRHESVERKLPGKKNGTKAKHVYRSDVNFREWSDNLVVGWPVLNNKGQMEKYAKHYLDQEEKLLKITAPQSSTYIGFEPISPDGAITQVTWFVNDSGEGRTRASRNREESNVAATFQEKRQNEQLAGLVAKNAEARAKDKGKFGE